VVMRCLAFDLAVRCKGSGTRVERAGGAGLEQAAQDQSQRSGMSLMSADEG